MDGEWVVAVLRTLGDFVAWCVARPSRAVVAWYTIMSFVTLLSYWQDKRAAISGGWRTPERVLHSLEFLGGWPGALIGQRLFHHKCSKPSYQFEFGFVVLLNVVVLAYGVYGYTTSDWRLGIFQSTLTQMRCREIDPTPTFNQN